MNFEFSPAIVVLPHWTPVCSATAFVTQVIALEENIFIKRLFGSNNKKKKHHHLQHPMDKIVNQWFEDTYVFIK